MVENLTHEQKVLAALMTDISERCYHAGWMINLEYVLWDALTSGPRKYGHGAISREDIIYLKEHSDKIGCWIIFDDQTEETAINLDDWKKMFKIRVKHNPNLLNE